MVPGTVLARVAPGQCLVAPSRALSCRVPWEEGGAQQYAWFAGSLDNAGHNQVFVGLPPTMRWSGSWRLDQGDAPIDASAVLDPPPSTFMRGAGR
jgi:hypothetical protein